MRGQLTVFMILGLLLLIILGLVFFIPAQTTSSSSTSGSSMNNPVRQLITSCLEDATINGLLILGKQGAIYESQGGSATTGITGVDTLLDSQTLLPTAPQQQARVQYWNVFPGTSKNTSLTQGITQEITQGITQEFLLLEPEPPEYPFKQFPFTSIGTRFSCSCGKPLIPPLENEEFSLQDQLERFVETYVRTCAAWQTLQQQNILVVEQDQPRAQVRFGENDVISTLHWPLRITISSTIFSINEPYSATYPVRIRAIHEKIAELLQKDSTNLLFNITQNIQTIQNDIQEGIQNTLPNDGIAQAITLNKRDLAGDDIITATDTLSQVKTHNYSLTFARHNRPPALWHINQTLLDQFVFCPDSKIWIENNSWLMMDNTCNNFPNPIVHNPPALSLKATDPDSDTVQYKIWAGGKNKGQTYTLSADAIDAGKDFKETFKQPQLIIRADDGHLADYQVLNITAGFQKQGTTGLVGTTGSFAGTITIPGVPIEATITKILLDDCGGLTINGNTTFENRPCGDSGNPTARVLNGNAGHIGGTNCPSGSECDAFRPTIQAWMLLHKGANQIRIDLHVDSGTGTPDAWTTLEYVYLTKKK